MLRNYLVTAVAIALTTILATSALTTQAQAGLGTPYPRHSPDVILKILGTESLTNVLKDLVSSVNPDPLLGSGGVKPLNSSGVKGLISRLSSNASLSTSLTNEDLQKLSAVSRATGSELPPDLRYDLSLAASLVKNKALRELLKEWASKGYIDLNELRSRVDLSSLSREDLAILKALLGLASKYGLVSRDDLIKLGLGKVSPEDVKALAKVLEEASRVSKSVKASGVLSELAKALAKAAGNTSLLTNVARLINNPSAPHIGKALIEGLSSLSSGVSNLKQLGYVPKATLPSVPKPSVPKLSLPTASLPKLSTGALLPIVATSLAIVIAYIAYKYLNLASVMVRVRRKVESGLSVIMRRFSGVNAEVIRRYWEGVAFLSRAVPRYDSETHREYLRKVYGLGGEEFKELTNLYEIARWSGRSLSEEDLLKADELLSRIKSRALR